MRRICRRLRVHGVVQGVGFRPFVYRAAVEAGLAGSVRNLGDAGVEILVEGDEASVERFLKVLREDSPPLARVERLESQTCEAAGRDGFSIAPSADAHGGRGSTPPDTAICDACAADVLGESRYRGYWATSCTDCGPRFTVIEGLPYDRPLTSMSEFPMCENCAREYTDPLDRRYHAQTIACASCGPRLTFDGSEADPIDRAIAALLAGEILSIKGIGGTHIACDATNEGAVGALRSRLGRPGQPFALMASEDVLSEIAEVTAEELELLRSPERPIVVLRQRPGRLPEGVAPGLHTIGVMLPYTGLHVLLFACLGVPLVMTSANLPNRPMLIENAEILERLGGIVDHHLLHDRRIVARCDDSVRRRVGGRNVFLRRSRGHVPGSIPVELGQERILALGPETGLTFTLYADGVATPSQHIGSVDDLETYEFLEAGIEHLKRLTGFVSADVVACDLHPQFLTTQLARRLGRETGARVVRVQHHVAHLASLMGEHGEDRVVGIVLDGYGYGLDGSAWGGEVLLASDGAVERVGSLRPIRLPGGDAAARQPLRVAAAILREAGAPRSEILGELGRRGLREPDGEALLRQIERGVNAPWTTSAGRFLDAVAAWFGIATERTYEGEPAMRLEAAAARGRPVKLEARRRDREGLRVLDTVDLFLRLIEFGDGASVEDAAATAQRALAEGVASVAIEVARSRGVETVGLSGGVGYNDAIASSIARFVEAAGLRYVTNERVPCGDGGVSFGQVVFAGRSLRILEADGAEAASLDDQE